MGVMINTDLVKALRAVNRNETSFEVMKAFLIEAADEIERLRRVKEPENVPAQDD
jgi:hypothetical protein